MPDASVDGLSKVLKEKLAMDDVFIKEEISPVRIRRNLERKPKNKHEICVTFESKQVRDLIKAQGSNLASYRDEAGMRLQIPDHLQKDFKGLMAVAYDMKQTSPDFRRNINLMRIAWACIWISKPIEMATGKGSTHHRRGGSWKAESGTMDQRMSTMTKSSPLLVTKTNRTGLTKGMPE